MFFLICEYLKAKPEIRANCASGRFRRRSERGALKGYEVSCEQLVEGYHKEQLSLSLMCNSI